MSGTLLLPCAGHSSRYPGMRPKWLLTLPDGELVLKRAADSVPHDTYERIVVTVRAEHDAAYHCATVLRRLFPGPLDVVVLSRQTQGPADTIFETIRRADVQGPITIKDCDSFLTCAQPMQGTFAGVVDLRAHPKMTNVGAKSFAVLDATNRITRIVEKDVVSNHVCVGLYGFADAGLFLEHFRAVALAAPSSEIFVSHVLAQAIGQGLSANAVFATNYVDIGTVDEWATYTRTRGTIVCDLDGVVFKNQSKHFPPYWDDAAEPIAANVAELRSWQAVGAQIIFMTARPEAHRARTMTALEALGLQVHALIMGCHHGRRFLVNDHAASNPYPAAVGLSLPRNMPVLGEHMKDWR